MAACGSSSSQPTSGTSAAATSASGGAGPGGSGTGSATGGSTGQTVGTGTSGTSSGGASLSSSGGSSTGISGTITTLAGNGMAGGGCAAYGNDGSFSPLLLVIDGAGNVYVTSDSLDEIAPGGTLTSLAGFSGMTPNGLASTAAGLLFYSETANFSNITTITQVMGATSTTLFSGGVSCYDTGSAGGAAGIGSVEGIAADSMGNVYVADGECFTVRKVTPSGSISTLAGTPGTQGSMNGPGSTAEFSALGAITIDPSGNLFVVDSSFVRKILPDGTTSTVAAGVIEAGGIAADANGNVYFSDDQANTVRKFDSSGRLTTVAGNGTIGYFNGTLGPNGTTEFDTPTGVAVDGSGNIYVADTANCYVRVISPGQ